MRVLVIDDTVVYRKIVSDSLASLPGVEVVGTASNGVIALSRIKALKPDVITLDVEMPEMSGLDVLEALRRESLEVCTIMISSLTTRGGEMTMKALELGAFDFITKPEGGSTDQNLAAIRQSLAPLMKAYADQQEIKDILRGRGVPLPQAAAAPPPAYAVGAKTSPPRSGPRQKPEIIGIGVSTGGPNALARMLPSLPGDLNVPILIVQHMPPLFTLSLANSLNAKCSFRVKEAENGEPVLANTAYIAPGGKQMKVALGANASTKIIHITDDPPENHCKPSVDYAFRSLAHHFLGRSTGVILTGMGNDGVLGLRLMKRHGSMVIAQDQASCVVFGMPKEAIDAGVVDIIAPLDRIAQEIVRTVR